jgi:hypothetical protein
VPVYGTVILAFVWMLVASWLMFYSTGDISLDLGIIGVLFVVMLGLPVLLIRFVAGKKKRTPIGVFVDRPMQTGSGSMPGSEVWAEILLIPLVLALAATVIGAAWLMTGAVSG